MAWSDLQPEFGFLPTDQMASVSLRPDLASVNPVDGVSVTQRLPRYLVRDAPAEASDDGRAVVALAGLLGKGGMGVVNLGEQLSLQRAVAVKRTRPEVSSARARQQLMREAVVTGALDHPNIVPVYDLARDDGDRPLLLMKRIEGRSWEQALADRPRPGSSGWLAWLEAQLEILIHVCNAVAFAHSRGILHRDLKPDNVMLGHFGEVFVVDWGVAVSTRAEDGDRFPLAADSRHVAGTPAYMAPELVCADADALGERTDVYLLGAILHEVLSGRPPHDAESALTSLYHAFESKPPTFADAVPDAIATICRRAMAREPEQRFASAAELRDATRSFLSSRASLHLARTGQRLLERLRLLIGDIVDELESPTLTEGGEPMRLFTESRFAFRQALDVWPDNETAREGLMQVITLGVQSAVQHGDLRTARLLMADLPTPEPELQADIDALAAQQQRDRARMQRLERLGVDFDLSASWGSRRLLVLALVLFWSIEPFTLGVLRLAGHYEPTYFNTHLGAAILLLMVALAGLYARKSWGATAVNRSLYAIAVLLAVSTAINRLVMDLAGVSLEQSMITDIAVYAMAAGGASAATADPRLMISAGIYLVAAVCAGLWPGGVHIVVGLANLLALGLMVVLWRPEAQKKARAASARDGIRDPRR